MAGVAHNKVRQRIAGRHDDHISKRGPCGREFSGDRWFDPSGCAMSCPSEAKKAPSDRRGYTVAIHGPRRGRQPLAVCGRWGGSAFAPSARERNLPGWVSVEAGQAAKNLVIVFLIRG